MADQEQLDLLKHSVAEWNAWRTANPAIIPDLSEADLSGAQLQGAHLGGAQLRGAQLQGAQLQEAQLQGANLEAANLEAAHLMRANLEAANLTRVNLEAVDLKRANLKGVDLTRAQLLWTNLKEADLHEAMLGVTTFGNTDLSGVKGLETVEHISPSTIGIDTLYKSGGKLPEAFLRGCGVPDSFIEYVPSLIGAIQPIQFYSCFISYSSQDEALAKRLHADLQANHVRVWFAPEDLKIGDRIRIGIDESIRVYDKLLIILSQHSLASQWVEQEVETALAKERAGAHPVLFPIRLDDAVMGIASGWPALIRNTRHIGDFSHWKEHDAFEAAFARLLRDLRAAERTPLAPGTQ